eukprot:CFRG7491T1
MSSKSNANSCAHHHGHVQSRSSTASIGAHVPRRESRDLSGRVHKPALHHKLSEGAKAAVGEIGRTLSHNQLPLRISEVSIPGRERDIPPNSREPLLVENVNCHGHCLFKLRTQPIDPYYASYFEGRKRMFEIMVQGHLLNVSESDEVFMGIMGNQAIEIGNWMSRWAAAAMVGFIKLKVDNVHVTLGDETEFAHMTMPVTTAADRFVVSKQDESPPLMGVHMFPELIPRKDRAKYKDWNEEYVYSMSMHGMYVDWVNWKLVNIPGMSDMCLSTFFGDMPLNIVAYAIPRGHVGPHAENIKRYIVNFKLEHAGIHNIDA